MEHLHPQSGVLCTRVTNKGSPRFGPYYPSYVGIGPDEMSENRIPVAKTKIKVCFLPHKQDPGMNWSSTVVWTFTLCCSNYYFCLMYQITHCLASPQLCIPARERDIKGMSFMSETLSRNCTCHFRLYFIRSSHLCTSRRLGKNNYSGIILYSSIMESFLSL